MENKATNPRLASLDTLRGADMFLILGVGWLVQAICGLFPGGADSWLSLQMTHVKWDGLRLFDTIFPLFLFIAGISFPFSYSKQLSKGASRGSIYKKIISRGIGLVIIGIIYGGIFSKLRFDSFRIPSVLGRIGLAWMFAALLFINFKRCTRIVISAVILIGYMLLICLVPAPDAAGAGPLTLEGNLVGYIDRCIMPHHIIGHGRFDPEGLLSTLPAIVTAMLGMFTGEFVRNEKYTGNRKTLLMLAAAVVMLGLGLLLSHWMPINKKLWSSSFVLVVGAWSLFLFAIFYWVIDVKGCNGWTMPFRVIGMNSITVYLVNGIFGIDRIAKFFIGWIIDLVPEAWGEVVAALGHLAVIWLLMYFLYKHKIFFKI